MKKCEQCMKVMKKGEEREHHSTMLCEDCCLQARISPVRKTHWQYLGSIKKEYLRPGMKSKA